MKNGTYYGKHLRRAAGSGRAVGCHPQGLRSLSRRVFMRSLSNLVNMLVGIISRPSSITSQIPQGTPELWPLNCPKLGFLLAKSKSFHPVFIKHGEHVGRHNISTKFYNQPVPPMHSWIMALELSKIRVYTLLGIEFSTGVFCVSLALLLLILHCIIFCVRGFCIIYNRHNPNNVPPPSKPEDSIFCKTNKFYWMKVNITI